ncbi:MAG: pilin [Patescibacteria group bacterium]
MHGYLVKLRAWIIGFLIGLSLLGLPVAAGAQGGLDPRGNPPEQFRDVLPFQSGPGATRIENLPDRFQSLAQIVATIFNIVIGISGSIFMVLLLIGGIQYMTAAGNEENTTKAKKLLVDAVIGLVLTLSAWAIGTFILRQFYLPTSGIIRPGGGASSGGIGGGGGAGPVAGGGGPGTGSTNTNQINAAFNAGFDAGQRSFAAANNDPNAACDKTGNPNYRPTAVASQLQAEYDSGFETGCSNSGTRR